MRLWLRLAYRLLRVFWFVRRPITVGVRILLVRGDSILLVRHTYQDEWYIPGGGVKRGERLDQAIRREAAEEGGINPQTLNLFGVYTSFSEYKNDHIIVFYSDDFTLS